MGTCAPRPAGSLTRTEPVSRHRIDALVVDSRLPDRHRTSRGRYLAGGMAAVADHQPVAVLVNLAGVGVDVGGDLGLQRRRQHPAGAFTGQLVQNVPTDRDRCMCVVGIVNYGEHERTFPNQRTNAGPDQSFLDFRSSSGRCAPSRHPAEGHPQVLIIAPSAGRDAACGCSWRRAPTSGSGQGRAATTGFGWRPPLGSGRCDISAPGCSPTPAWPRGRH